jgi:tRNA G46 methylase TrmB
MREFNARKVPQISLEAQTLSRLEEIGRFDLEIGAGQGLHAIRYCQTHPDRVLLAVERTKTKYSRLNRRALAHQELTGLLPLHADAVSIVTHHIAARSIERVFLLYPNPYPKSKQSNLRWHNSPFFGELLKKMSPGATLVLATNLKWYADEAQDRMTRDWGLQLIERRSLSANFPPRTHFEKKYLLRGEICYDLLFQWNPPSEL